MAGLCVSVFLSRLLGKAVVSTWAQRKHLLPSPANLPLMGCSASHPCSFHPYTTMVRFCNMCPFSSFMGGHSHSWNILFSISWCSRMFLELLEPRPLHTTSLPLLEHLLAGCFHRSPLIPGLHLEAHTEIPGIAFQGRVSSTFSNQTVRFSPFSSAMMGQIHQSGRLQVKFSSNNFSNYIIKV